MTNGFTHSYHLGESTVILRGIRSDFKFFSSFDETPLSMQIAPDGKPRSMASHLGLYRLPMSHKKDARLIRINILTVLLLTC